MPSIYRLDRPFGEPGIAQIFMNYGIIYNLFFINKNERQRKWIILFVIGSILSFSLIGYLILLFIIFLKLFREKKYGMCLVCIVPAVIIGSIMVIQKMTTLSYNDRVNDYSFMFETIVENFPFGIGIGHTGELEHTILENDSTSIGFYCGVLYPLAQYGIFGLIYYWALFKGIHNIINNQTRYEKKFSNIIFAIFIVLTLLTEPQADEPLILCFIFDGLQRYFNTKKGMEVRNDFNYMSSNG